MESKGIIKKVSGPLVIAENMRDNFPNSMAIIPDTATPIIVPIVAHTVFFVNPPISRSDTMVIRQTTAIVKGNGLAPS